MLRRLLLAAPCVLALLAPADAFAQKTLKVGFPMILSGPGADAKIESMWGGTSCVFR